MYSIGGKCMKRIIYSSILTCIFIFSPAFMVKFSSPEPVKNQSNTVDISREIEYQDIITVFSSNTCYKKTYYVNADKVYAYGSPGEGQQIAYTVLKDEPVISYKEQNGYVYCEEGTNGKK
jgi:hypothetical protein